ncbi:MAG: hypothetical protein U0793_06120 [Gemmataceae bacterium]
MAHPLLAWVRQALPGLLRLMRPLGGGLWRERTLGYRIRYAAT